MTREPHSKISDIREMLSEHSFVLTEAAINEVVRHSGKVRLHPRLEHALMVYDEVERDILGKLYQDYIRIAQDAEVPIIICAPTWRANFERISESGIKKDVNGDAVEFMRNIRDRNDRSNSDIYIGGLLGCKNDCYRPEQSLSNQAAKEFHSWQIERLAQAGVDFLLAATLPALPEAVGIAAAMAETGLPYIISFVIDRQGKILDGTSLDKAFEKIDDSVSVPPLGYMINCSYPSFLNPTKQPESVFQRLIGCQGNASSLDHCQLDASDIIKKDDVSDWGDRMIELNRIYGVKILGGCCGTGTQHLKYIVNNINL